jgi:hypothetical protein
MPEEMAFSALKKVSASWLVICVFDHFIIGYLLLILSFSISQAGSSAC